MSSPRNYITVLWVIALLQLTACSHTPVASTPGAGSASIVADPMPQSMQASRLAVLRTAQRMLGTPYRYGGASPTGFDCSGLVWFSHKRAGIRVPRTASQQQRSALQRVSIGDLQAGDLVFFRIGSRRTDHVGIYVGNGRFIHAPSSGGKVSQASLNNAYWKNRLHSAGNYY